VLAQEQGFEGGESKPKGLGNNRGQHAGREVVDTHHTLKIGASAPDILDRLCEEP
jgi:hypothetical protein